MHIIHPPIDLTIHLSKLNRQGCVRDRNNTMVANAFMNLWAWISTSIFCFSTSIFCECYFHTVLFKKCQYKTRKQFRFSVLSENVSLFSWFYRILWDFMGFYGDFPSQWFRGDQHPFRPMYLSHPCWQEWTVFFRYSNLFYNELSVSFE